MAEGESPNDGPNKATGGGLGERIPPPEQLVALGKRIAGVRNDAARARATGRKPGAFAPEDQFGTIENQKKVEAGRDRKDTDVLIALHRYYNGDDPAELVQPRGNACRVRLCGKRGTGTRRLHDDPP